MQTATPCPPNSFATGLGDEQLQVAPAVPAVKLAARAVKPLCAEGFVESVGRIRGLAEEEHRRDTPLDEPTRHRAQEEPTDALTVNPPQHVNLVQFALETGHPTVVWRALRKTDQLANVILDDEAKPATICDRKCLPPLTLS